MAMKIEESYDRSALSCAQRLREEEQPDKTGKGEGLEKAAESKRAKEPQKAQDGGNAPKGLPVPRDEYISSERAGIRPSGLYRLGRDEDGRPKVFYDDSRKSDQADGKGKPEVSGKGQPKPGGTDAQESEEKCIADTDKVEREIRQLKEKKQQLEQQLRAASGDEKRARELEQKLAQVENELSRKDNDVYRRQNASVISA